MTDTTASTGSFGKTFRQVLGAGLAIICLVLVGWFLICLIAGQSGGLGNLPQALTGLVRPNCGQPFLGKDEKGEYWGMGGIRYRNMTPRPNANEPLCLRNGRAFWEIQL